MINPAIFRAYDIRGNSNSDITAENAYKVGFAFAQLNITTSSDDSNNKIVVARDGRLSSPVLYEALVRGLQDAGASVISIGIGPTPMLYFADKKLTPAASIMITGSHNAKDDNGFKMVAAGKPFYGEKIKKLLQTIEQTDWASTRSAKVDRDDVTEDVSIKSEYIRRLLLDCPNIDPSLKVAWDSGNGAAGEIVEQLVSHLPNLNISINSTIDGNFPNHHPDPTVPSNLTQLIEVVRSHSCDFGIAFDGDADRIGVVLQSGEIIWGDQLLCLFAKDILKIHAGGVIIADVKASQIVFDQVREYGGEAVMWKTGHSLIKTKMAETGALLAGEMSGHMFFADKYYGYDDAIYTALRLLYLVSREELTLSDMVKALPKTYNTPEIRIKSTDESKFVIIEAIKQKLKDNGQSFNDVDGLRVTNSKGWWLLRASNTEGVIIARCEGFSENGLQDLKFELGQLLEEYSLKLP